MCICLDIYVWNLHFSLTSCHDGYSWMKWKIKNALSSSRMAAENTVYERKERSEIGRIKIEHKYYFVWQWNESARTRTHTDTSLFHYFISFFHNFLSINIFVVIWFTKCDAYGRTEFLYGFCLSLILLFYNFRWNNSPSLAPVHMPDRKK